MTSVSMFVCTKWPSVARRTVPRMPIRQCSFVFWKIESVGGSIWTRGRQITSAMVRSGPRRLHTTHARPAVSGPVGLDPDDFLALSEPPSAVAKSEVSSASCLPVHDRVQGCTHLVRASLPCSRPPSLLPVPTQRKMKPTSAAICRIGRASTSDQGMSGGGAM